MEQLSFNDALSWGSETQCCTLCESADDAGSAMAYLKQLDTALGGRTTDTRLATLMLESYNTFFYEPAVKAGDTPPKLTEDEITTHFTEHDINPLRQLRKDINRLNAIQDSLAPRGESSSGRIVCNDGDAKSWANLQRLKMDLVKQYETCDKNTSRTMPTLG